MTTSIRKSIMGLAAMTLSVSAAFGLDPNAPGATDALRLNDEGVSLLAKGDAEGGIAKLKEALDADPGCAEAARNLAKIAFSSQRFALAENVLADALAVHQGEVSLLVPYAQATAKLRHMDKFAESIVLLSANGDVETLSGLSLLLMAQGNPDEAIMAVDAAISNDEGNAEAYFNKGLIRENQKRWAEAAFAYGRSIECNPGLFRSWVNLGNVQDKLGRADEAIASYEKALALEKDNPLAQYNLGRMLVKGKRDVDRGVDLLVAAANNKAGGAAQKAALELINALLAKKSGK